MEQSNKTSQWSTNTIGIINLVLLVVILVMWATGNFGWGVEQVSPNEIEDAVTEALEDFDFPTVANAPSAEPTDPAPQPAPAPANKIAMNELESFYEGAYIDGNEDAPVTVIEFSDVECPFCQRHTNNGTLDQVKEKYWDDVNVVYAHFPLSMHPHAQKAGEALECVWDIAWGDAFWSYKAAVYAKWGKPTLDVLEATAEEEGLDVEAVMDCVSEGTFAQKVKDQMAFGRKLGVTGTPGNIVMNNENGEYTKVSGAVPAGAFDGPISELLE